uniref:Uncharacterized protein n=1 Tax=Ixodes ricinus TaxID=34613 RepID=A0A6B0UW96_IXORI
MRPFCRSLRLSAFSSTIFSVIATAAYLIQSYQVRTASFSGFLIVPGVGSGQLTSPLKCCQDFLGASLLLHGRSCSSCLPRFFIFFCTTAENSIFFSLYFSHTLKNGFFLRSYRKCFPVLFACLSHPVPSLCHSTVPPPLFLLSMVLEISPLFL